MGRLLHLIANLCGKLAGRYVAILALILAVAWFQAEWAKLNLLKRESDKTQLLLTSSREEQRIASAKMDTSPWSALREKKVAEIRAIIKGIDEKLSTAAPHVAEKLKKLASEEELAKQWTEALQRERAALDALRSQIQWHDHKGILGWGPNSNERKLNVGLQEAKVRFYEESIAVGAKVRAEIEEYLQNSQAELAREKKAKEMELSHAQNEISPEELRLREELKAKESATASLEETLQRQQEQIASDPRQRALNAIFKGAPVAFWILMGITVVPPIIKGVAFFVVAPLARRVSPIQILQFSGGTSPTQASDSATSQEVVIQPDEELLVHPDYIQSSSVEAKKATKALLNWKIPFSSVAAGLWLLTQVRPRGNTVTKIVVSAQKDPLAELGCIELQSGVSMVMHPRSIAGLVQHQGCPVRISRHWRLFSAHAWLTLQLRYLVFHGPCRLVLKGCRGIRLERPDRSGRMINQANTIGFSANIQYRNIRSETFIPYLLGKEDLFNDLFTGEDGVFVYEEVPGTEGKGGLTGRWLEGFLDAVLKIFGV